MRVTWGVDSRVVYPPVEVDFDRAGVQKGKTILSIGRFDPLVKKQDVLVRSFIELCDSGLRDWEFVLIGGVNDRAEGGGATERGARFVEDLKAMSRGYPVRYLTNATRAELNRNLATASLFWHAAGIGQESPGMMEHFGIVTVEAMAAGCVPLVYNGGGQPEIVRRGQDGYTWDTPHELIELTKRLAVDEARVAELSASAVHRSGDFSRKVFEANLLAELDRVVPGRLVG